MAEVKEMEKLPEGWKKVRLGEVMILKNGKAAKILEDGKYPIYGSNGLMGYTDNYYLNGTFILIGRVGASGEIHMARGKLWASDNCLVGECKSDTNPVFMYYLLKHKELKKSVTQTAQPLITQSFISNIYIPLPPLPEQRKIAEILETVDNAIEKTDKIIEKYKRIKQGLMQDLLTKGIDENGQIRSEKTHKFKDSPLGRIPEEWEVLHAEKVCTKITDGTHETPKPLETGYYYLVTSKHLKNGSIDFSEAYFISEKDFITVNKRSKVDIGDLLFSMIGTIGMVAIVKREYPLFAIKNVGLFKSNANSRWCEWLYYYFQSELFQKYINRNLKGTSQKYIPLNILKILPVISPPFKEKCKIIKILSQIDETIEKEQKYKEKLERVKRGLMEDLLTGKVRVNHLMEDEKNVS